MYGKLEVIAYWKGKRTVRYYEVKLYNGVTCDIYDQMEAKGYTHINVHLMPC